MALHVSDISFGYSKGNPVVSNFSLEVGEGEIVALVGSSGCGKTTLLHCIAGLLSLDSGAIIVGDKTVTHMKPHERGVGIMMQDQPLYEHMTVAQNISFPLRARGIKQDVSSLVEKLQLSHIATQKVAMCSGGERRRVALGRVLVLQPRVLLLDEPLISLDKKLRTSMQQLIENVHETANASTIIVTHNYEEAEAQSDRIIKMENL